MAKPSPAVRPMAGGGGVYIDEPDPALGSIGKKRKVPAFPIPLDRQDLEDLDDDDSYDHAGDLDTSHNRYTDTAKSTTGAAITYKPNYNLFISRGAKAATRNKAIFLRRKAALISLYLDAQKVIIDAQNAILEGKLRLGSAPTKLPEVTWFEKLIPALEGMGIHDWPMDAIGWRSGVVEDVPKRNVRAGAWKMDFEQRKRARLERTPVERGGWFPEGSFEFEKECQASVALRQRAKSRTALAKLAHELRALILTSNKTPKPLVTEVSDDDDAPSKTKRRLDTKRGTREKLPAKRTGQPGATLEEASRDLSAKKENNDPKVVGEALSKTTSSQGSDHVSGVKKKKGKKKRSALANQSNPHHVDNYRPSRTVANAGNPSEPYPHHASLLFPPPMRFLAARPKGKDGTPSPPVRAGEDDFLCSFCEYALFFGSESLRKKAIRQRRKELKKKMEIKARAKNVAEGNGKGRLGKEDDEEEEYSDEEGECGDEGGCYGRCKCGRPISEPTEGKTKKPPDIQDHVHDHDHDHHHHHHNHPASASITEIDDSLHSLD